MKSQFFAIINLSGVNSQLQWTLSVDVDLTECENADNSQYEIISEIADKFNKTFEYHRKVEWSDIIVKVLCKMK